MPQIINKKTILLFFFIILISGVILFINQKNKSKNLLREEQPKRERLVKDENNSFKNYQQEIKTTGYFNLETINNKNKFSLNEEVEILLTAQTENIKVTAFDVIINYQEKDFNLISANFLGDDFTLFKFKKPNRIILTAVKKPNINQERVFSNQKIIVLKFKPKIKGRFEFNIASMIGKEKTQFVDQNSQIYYPKANKLTVEIYWKKIDNYS